MSCRIDGINVYLSAVISGPLFAKSLGDEL